MARHAEGAETAPPRPAPPHLRPEQAAVRVVQLSPELILARARRGDSGRERRAQLAQLLLVAARGARGGRLGAAGGREGSLGLRKARLGGSYVRERRGGLRGKERECTRCGRQGF